MNRRIERITFPFEETFDEIIDVRSPSEYAEDHLEGAINLPVLSDAERAEVGTVYRQVSPFEARKLGAALVTSRISGHLRDHFSRYDMGHRMVLYCWRGGQRSASFAAVLSEIGWRVSVLDGGYKAYRKQVIKEIERCSESFRFRIINGFTGSGKTLLLKALEKMGSQVLDLEELARHRGSLFGGRSNEGQPSQKRFESLIYEHLIRCDPNRPIFVEAESPKIGGLFLPVGLWRCLRRSTVVELRVPLEVRARYLVEHYSEWCEDPERVASAVSLLRSRHSRAQIDRWLALVSEREWPSFVRSLLEEHYDQSYGQNGSGYYSQPSLRICLADHSENSIEEAVRAILAEIDEGGAPLSD